MTNKVRSNSWRYKMSTNDKYKLDGFIRLKSVLQIFPVSKTAWFQGVKDGRYPKPIRLAPRTSVYRVSDIRELIDKLGADQ